MKPESGLRPADLDAFAKLGIRELLGVAGVRRVTHDEAQSLCGITYKSDHLEGIAFPYRDPATDQPWTWRVRRDAPEVDADGEPIAKYVCPPERRHFYFGPGSAPLLADPSVPAIFVEAEKSVLATGEAEGRLGRRRALLIATGGCWGWRGIIGKTTTATGVRVNQKGPLPDFNRIVWTGRDVVILFDANASTNDHVQAARRALAVELNRRGARVRIAELPVEAGLNGPDDFVARHGDGPLFALIDAATAPPNKSTKPSAAAKPPQGQAVLLEDPEPWAAPVDGAELLTGISHIFESYLALPAHASTILALWALHCYAFAAWFTSPFLGITSPVKRCGKTLTLIVLGALVPRRLFASNVTPAVLFRTIEKFRPTLLIDEADTFIHDNDELRGLLNAGHTRTTAVAIRAVGDDHDPRAFSTWCPKAIALIGRLPSTLTDRAIEVGMRRRMPREAVQRLRLDRIDGDCEPLRRQAARWAADRLRACQAADPTVPDALHDRAADCWRPLLTIANLAGGDWPARARQAAIAGAKERLDEDVRIDLLHDIKGLFDGMLVAKDFIASTDVVKQLCALDERPWATFRKGDKPVTVHGLARLLKSFGIVPKPNKAGDVRGYNRADFAEAWARYPPFHSSQPSDCQNPNNDGPDSPDAHRQDDCQTDDSNRQTEATASQASPPSDGCYPSPDGQLDGQKHEISSIDSGLSDNLTVRTLGKVDHSAGPPSTAEVTDDANDGLF